MNVVRRWMPDIVILGMIAAALMLPSLNAHATDWLLESNGRSVGGMTSLMSAAAAGEFRCSERLLDLGVDVNAVDANGNTALFYAVMFDRAAVASLLLERGADPAARNHHGQTVLDRAREYRSRLAEAQLVSRLVREE